MIEFNDVKITSVMPLAFPSVQRNTTSTDAVIESSLLKINSHYYTKKVVQQQ